MENKAITYDDSKDLYNDVLNEDLRVVDVPLVVATSENFKEYGRFVDDFDSETVWISPWPTKGKRKLCPNTGIGGGVTKGENINRWEGDLIVNANLAIEWGKFYFGRLAAGASGSDRTHVLAAEANYHPDGGQVFYPTSGDAFVALLALPGDDIQPEDFKAFYLDGSRGIQIKAGVWHQPMYTSGEANFRGKQGAIFACVAVNFVKEFKAVLKVPLKKEFAK